MRTTRAIHAVERLKTRSGNPRFAAIAMPGGRFYLVDRAEGRDDKLCEPLALDEFVAFVNGYGPQQPRRTTKNDAAFEEQIKKSRG